MGIDSIIQQELFYSGHYRKRKEAQRNRKEKRQARENSIQMGKLEIQLPGNKVSVLQLISKRTPTLAFH